MVVPSTANGFRATVSALRSLDEKEGVIFHTFSLPEDRCVRLLVKNLRKRMLESVVREELESLNIRVQGVMQLRSGPRDQDPAKDRSPNHRFIVSVARGPEMSKVRSITQLCSLRVTARRTWRQRAHCNINAVSDSDTRIVTADTHPGASPWGGPKFLVDALPLGGSLSAVVVGATTRRATMAV
jgi:hypothetical protein